jgi:anti-anti-sigma factor
MVRALTVLEPDAAGRPGTALVVLRGDVDACDQAKLDRTRVVLARASAVHVDLAGLGFCGTAFLRFIAHVARQARATGASLFLRRVPLRVVRLLALVGMEPQFELRAQGATTTLRLRPKATAAAAALRA